jgi:hypothetical protein
MTVCSTSCFILSFAEYLPAIEDSSEDNKKRSQDHDKNGQILPEVHQLPLSRKTAPFQAGRPPSPPPRVSIPSRSSYEFSCPAAPPPWTTIFFTQARSPTYVTMPLLLHPRSLNKPSDMFLCPRHLNSRDHSSHPFPKGIHCTNLRSATNRKVLALTSARLLRLVLKEVTDGSHSWMVK